MEKKEVVYIEYEHGRVAKCNLRGKQLEPGGSERPRYEFILRHTLEGASVLDVGCNYGAVLTQLWQDRGTHGVGVDLDPDFIKLARNRRQGVGGEPFPVQYHIMPGENVGKRWLDAFDVAVLGEVIEHVPDPDLLLHSIWLALRPGGVLLLTTPNPKGFLARMVETNPEQHVRLLSRKDLRRLALRAGFVVEEIVDIAHTAQNDPAAYLGAVLRKPTE